MSVRRHPIAALVVAAMLAGGLIAAGIAVAGPGRDGDGRVSRGSGHTVLPAAPAGDPAAPVDGPPLTPPPGFRAEQWKAGEPVVEARAPDPLGGPGWVVRSFTLDAGLDGGATQCAQLGRERDGRFGWVDAENRFRELPLATQRNVSCAWPRSSAGRRRPRIELLTRVSDPNGPSMRPSQSVAWGIVGAGHTAAVTVDGSPVDVPRTPSGVVLAPLPPSASRPIVRADVSAGPNGDATAVESSFHDDGLSVAADAATPEGYTRQQWVTVPLPGSRPAIEYRVPDPGGRAPWGVVAAPARDGGWCVSQAGRIAGARVGTVDPLLGTFADAPPGWGMGCGAPAGRPTLRYPISGTWASWDGPGADAEDAAAQERVTRRVSSARTVFSGVAHPDVAAVTIATPRDVRTLTPSPRAHAFAVVYDDRSVVRGARMSVRLRDGRERSAPLYR